ncbi:MAG: phosphoserine phosphatase, partial [Candidatus Cloacimonetes bacterium]|nr:phosphoserine phosphatase [Candidatus Cloacimonadota bacterium]
MKQRQEKRGLAYQIIVFIFISLFLIFTAFIAITRILFSHIMMENAQETVSHLANETTYQIENRLTSVVNISRTILTLYRYDHFERNKLDSILHDWVYEFENLEAITIAYAPSYYQEGYSRTIFHSHNRAVYQELHPADYQYLD